MGLLGFSFGKKRRSTKRRSTKKHSHRKPPAKLLRLCRKYRVKATKKVGKKKVYKSVASLKKMCLRKARALRKKLLKAHKKSMKHHKKSHKRRMHHTRRRRSGFGFGARESDGEGRIRFPGTSAPMTNAPMSNAMMNAIIANTAAPTTTAAAGNTPPLIFKEMEEVVKVTLANVAATPMLVRKQQ